jgi:hypothetical protein
MPIPSARQKKSGADAPCRVLSMMMRSPTLEAMLKALAAMMVLLPFAALGLFIVMLVLL